MHRLRIQVLAVLCLAGLPVLARPLLAQQGDAARTYTVKKGDTLWDIAKSLLGDAFLWPEIYRLNTGTIEDPHWIYPGETLRMPGAGSAALPASQPASPMVEGPEAPSTGRTFRTTVFNPDMAKSAREPRASLILRSRSAAVRSGDFLASPFMWAKGGPGDHGRIDLSAESHGIPMTLEQRPLQYQEPLFVTIPKGMQGNVGERLLTYRLGAIVEGQGQVVIPTGIVRLISASVDGVAQAHLIQQFEEVYTGQGATVLDTLSIPPNTFPKPVASGLTTSVVWLYGDPVLPARGQYLVLAASAADGLMPGDQLSLRRPHSSEAGGVVRSEEEVAVAQVTRVTRWGVSALVLEQQQVGIVDGMRATVTAKMP
ncbi:MAG: hypothetical protein PVSMB1_03540 [Gemmatimonadaceae bacterium]